MTDSLWRLIAFIVSRPAISHWLIKLAMRRPYTHIMSPDGKDLYMGRWWLFNPYSDDHHKMWEWLPSIRIHHIKRPDLDRHHHDHPWDARMIILRGWYQEQRLRFYSDSAMPLVATFARFHSDTETLKYQEYHRIERVSPGGVWTMFITWKYQGPWGYYVDGTKVPHRLYLKREAAYNDKYQASVK